MPKARVDLLTSWTRARDPGRASFADGWVGLEPTFQSKKSIQLYARLENQPGGEDVYFNHRHMKGVVRKVARGIARLWERAARRGAGWTLFRGVKVKEKLDPWKVLRAECEFQFSRSSREDFEVKFGMDPSTFEFGIKPVPLAWLYDERFAEFLDHLIFGVPRKMGLTPSMLNGGGQFHLSAKSYLTGSLLADDLATRLNHPELSTWIMDWPNCDDRALRATPARFAACRQVLADYWRGAFHPRATGGLTVEDAFFDRRYEPAPAPPRGLMDPRRGPVGSARDVFQANFTFGNAVRLRAQAVHPGYWQLAHPDDEGFRPDQIMRYSEINLNRLQIAGDLHVKSDAVLDRERIPELAAPLDRGLLAAEASVEHRGHMSRTSACDTIEAVLLEVHHALYLEKHPYVKVKATLLQDQLLAAGEATVARHAGARALDRLRRRASTENLQTSKGRIKSDFIEPETLFWEAWRALPQGERTAIAREAVTGFVERVHHAASMDPRGPGGDPMEPHRHRIHPLLWTALGAAKGLRAGDPARSELRRFREDEAAYLARRPVFSQLGDRPPWAGA
jgi:hypothetical protein